MRIFRISAIYHRLVHKEIKQKDQKIANEDLPT
jgi:hypothetical protein